MPSASLPLCLRQSLTFSEYLSRVTSFGQQYSNLLPKPRRWSHDSLAVRALLGPQRFYNGSIIDAAQVEALTHAASLEKSSYTLSAASSLTERSLVACATPRSDWAALHLRADFWHDFAASAPTRRPSAVALGGSHSKRSSALNLLLADREREAPQLLLPSKGGVRLTTQAARGLRLWVGALPPDVDEAALRAVFDPIARPTSIRIERRSGGRDVSDADVTDFGADGDYNCDSPPACSWEDYASYAILEFETASDAARALAELSYVPFRGRPLLVKMSIPGITKVGNFRGYERVVGAEVLVHSRAAHFIPRDLFVAFSRYGTVQAVRIFSQRVHGTCSTAVIRFANAGSAREALSAGAKYDRVCLY